MVRCGGCGRWYRDPEADYGECQVAGHLIVVRCPGMAAGRGSRGGCSRVTTTARSNFVRDRLSCGIPSPADECHSNSRWRCLLPETQARVCRCGRIVVPAPVPAQLAP